MENRILLSLLIKVLTRYRITSMEQIKTLPPQSVWSSTLKDEETVLNQCQRVLARRSSLVKGN
jgi:hypothetical protein